MAKLSYADIIERDQRYKMLADLGLRLSDIEAAKLMPRLVHLVAPEHLDLLAESRSILGADGYWLAESDQARRRLIKGAYELHRYKGTPWAIREIVRRLGFGEVEIIEGMGNKRHDGEITRNGRYAHGHSDRWAHYRVIMSHPVTNGQAALLRHTLRAFAPARCVLAALDYQASAVRHNGKITRDGRFNRGTA
ncbi:phage tail protein [Neisseria animalis]|uniref:Phage tail protein n=1 Tax=Neisseria animalis TaxID=492 RepID=A0A5P3MSE1_NEIAN|nr:phage tail protein [Neisseria animalis]QEY23559.1 phage tail protein [Neisseria animalis]ROW32159.1 phage tail protein [Neisseria animalis]VEE09218.1 putative phage tail protein [Neisseria animalis]